MLVVVKVVSDSAASAIKDKVDVSLYLTPSANENEIQALKSKINSLSEVKSVDYINKNEALEFFRQKNKDNPEMMQALRELGANPLTPSLVIKPQNTESLDALTHEINKIDSDIIQSRNFTDHEAILAKINSVTDKVNSAGIIVSVIFILITLLVVYNSIRVAIYTHEKEISIMRLVGASNSFIYMPFLFSSLFYTLIGLMVVISIFYPFLSLLQPYLDTFFTNYNINIIHFFNSHFFLIFGTEFVCIALINILASFIAVKKYSHI
jgi:cell division transport system permease protein